MQGSHVGGTTQTNILLVPLLDTAGMGGWYCVPHPERLIANQEYTAISNNTICLLYVVNASHNSYLKLYCDVKSQCGTPGSFPLGFVTSRMEA